MASVVIYTVQCYPAGAAGSILNAFGGSTGISSLPTQQVVVPADQPFTPPANCKVVGKKTVSQVYNKNLAATLARGTPPQLAPSGPSSGPPGPLVPGATPVPVPDQGFSLFGLSPLGIAVVAGGGYLVYRLVKRRFAH